MRLLQRAGIVLMAAGLAWLPGITRAASFDCGAQGLSPAEATICSDPQLSNADDQVARRITGLAQRITLGQYLGVRYWHFRASEDRVNCGDDRGCLAASYRSQNRTIERLLQCLDTSSRRRACLRATLSGESAALQQ